MLHKRLAPLTLLAFAAIAVPAQCSPSKGIDKKDCIVGLDGFCVDSIDFNPPPNDNLLAFATLPANPMDESSIFSDPFATDLETGLGTEDPGESGSLFSDYNDLDGFQLAASSRLGCTCPGDIPSTKVRNLFAPSLRGVIYVSAAKLCIRVVCMPTLQVM